MSEGLLTSVWEVGRPASPNRVMNSAQLIHFHLRDDIISMRRRPGEPIAEKDITQAYGVSRTPVREALLRLSEEGLIDIIAKSGTIVSRIPADELPEAILARKASEQMTARMAAELAAKSDVLKLSAIVERQKEALKSNDIDGFHVEDEALHRSIMAAAGQPKRSKQDRYFHEGHLAQKFVVVSMIHHFFEIRKRNEVVLQNY